MLNSHVSMRCLIKAHASRLFIQGIRRTHQGTNFSSIKTPIPRPRAASPLERLHPLYISRRFLSSDEEPPASASRLATPEYLRPNEKEIFEILVKELDPISLEVNDVSGGCGSMYSINIVSERFKGLSMLKQQKLVHSEASTSYAKIITVTKGALHTVQSTDNNPYHRKFSALCSIRSPKRLCKDCPFHPYYGQSTTICMVYHPLLYPSYGIMIRCDGSS
ncbi:hypothetical protein K3495_g4954 [Podosphaera aphanis]|nr:hypothetical protein K3495_g4954 [Podosphaera aphanis]